MEQQLKWDGIVRRHVDISIRNIGLAGRYVDVIASTSTIDSHGDILDQDWRLERYAKNPVVLWNHNRFDSAGGSVRPEDLLPIGRADVKVSKAGLEATLVFASADVSPLAERIFRLFQDRMLNAVSVGFRPGSITEELQPTTGRTIFRLSNNELMEISVVPMGSNPDAVAKSIAFEREQFAHLVRGTSPVRLVSHRSIESDADFVRRLDRKYGFDRHNDSASQTSDRTGRTDSGNADFVRALGYEPQEPGRPALRSDERSNDASADIADDAMRYASADSRADDDLVTAALRDAGAL